MSNDDVF